MGIYLEELKEEYIFEVAQLEKRCFSDPWSQKLFESELKNERSRFTVLKDGEKIIGYGCFWKIFDEGHIMNIAIAPEYRGKHLSDIIMKDIVEYSKKSGIVFLTLEVRSGNETAKNLYKKYGFKEAGVRKGYYSDNGEDAIIMWAEI